MNSSVASVNTAIASISNGTLAGLVPGAGLINTLADNQTAVTAFEAANKASIDAFVTKVVAADSAAGLGLGTTAADDIIAGTSSYQAKVNAVVGDAALIRAVAANGGTTTTNVLTADASDKAVAVTTAFNALSATEKTAATAYAAAVAKEAMTKTTIATAIEVAGVKASLTADTNAATVAALFNHTDATTLYAEYVNATAAQRTTIDNQFGASATYAAFKVSATKDAAYADAIKASLTAQDTVDSSTTLASTTSAGFIVGTGGSTINGVIISFTAGNETVATGSTVTNNYMTAVNAKAAADALVVSATKADLDVTAAKVLADAYKVQTDKVAASAQAITDFNTGSLTAKVLAITATTADPAVKESFYFAVKPTGVIGDDHAIATFGAGDSIVLGSGYTYNSGALSTGNNNAAEFFLVKTDTGVQVVAENTVYGSAGVTPVAATGVAAAADNLTVITLTGVTLDHLSVANGVVSYV